MNKCSAQLSTFFICLICIACTNSSKVQLEGHWTIVEARRSGQTAEALQGIFFTLNKNGKLITNFSAAGDTIQGDWELESKVLLLKTEDPADFELIELSDTTMRVLAEWHNFDFDLLCIKK